MLQLQAETGSLSVEAYMQGLHEAVVREVARSKELKVIPGGARRALEAGRHAKIMSDELKKIKQQAAEAAAEG